MSVCHYNVEGCRNGPGCHLINSKKDNFEVSTVYSNPSRAYPRVATLGCQALIFGTAVLYGRYAPRVPVKFSTHGCFRPRHINGMLMERESARAYRLP